MTLNDARKILGLGPDDDPQVHLAEFKVARERIAELVRIAPNDTLADRYQKGLIEFDQALAAIQEHLEAAGLAAPPLPTRPAADEVPISHQDQKNVELPAVAGGDGPAAEEIPPFPPRRVLSFIAWFLVFLVGASGGGWLYLKNEESKRNLLATRVAFLERQGSVFIENRHWQEAQSAFAEIESLSPGSEIALLGRRSIEAGMDEEQTQFVGYWTGQAIAELEAGRLDEATAAARQVLDKVPNHRETTAILARIEIARASQARAKVLDAARAQLDERKWDEAIATARKILALAADDSEAQAIVASATAAIEKEAANKTKAAELYQLASARDTGQFDQQALEWLREASLLDPANAAVAALLEKLSAYTRTIRVPGDFATPAEALATARDRDRVVLGGQVWKGPLVVNAAVDLQGADPTKTIVECSPEEGSAITIGPEAKGARISGISFRHESFAVGSDRFSVALVRGGIAAFVDCRFREASGHGLAVIEKGQASADRCRFSDNGWNGVAAIGEGSTLEVKDSESINNFENGIESWEGAAVILTNNRCEANSRNGIHTDNGLASATIHGNQLIANREFGIVLGSAGSGAVSANVARDNLLGGLVIRSAAAKVVVTKNTASRNQGSGLVLEAGLPPASYADNSITGNANPQIVTNAELDQPDSEPPSKEAAPPRAIRIEPAPPDP